MQRQPSFWGFFARLFASPPKPTKRRNSAIRTRSSSPAPAELPETFEAYAELLGVETLAPAPLTDEQWEEVVILKGQLSDKLKGTDVAPQAVPATALRVLNLVATDDPDVGDLARAVGHDPSISSGVLRVANSAAVSPGTHTISSVRDAVARLGTEEVGRVAGAIAARSLFNPQTRKERSVFEQRFYDLHLGSVVSAAGASQLAMQLRKGRSDTAYLGGMLHDIGKSVVLVGLSRLVLEGVVAKTVAPGVVDTVLEEMHVEVGSELHLEWGLPDQLTELCACHHDGHVPEQEGFEEAHLVRVVGGLLALRREPAPTHGTDELLQSARVLGITPKRLRAVDAELRELSERMSTILRA